jgi:uncharacterized protein (TIGR01777 family)
LVHNGHEVRWLSRSAGAQGAVKSFAWDPRSVHLDVAAVQGVDHIVHLAGAGIADERWTTARVQELIDSRALSAQLLMKAFRQQGIAPKSFVSAAGINYYGAVTSDHIHSESDAPGTDTISRISVEWEAAVDQWASLCRVVKLRTPVVLSADGGALTKLSAPVRWGLGAALGSGKQWMPWVHLDDLVRIYLQALADDTMNGAYNVNAPEHATNAQVMRTVAKVLGKPFFLPPVPGLLLRFALGDMASILLEGSRASNAKLSETGFRFTHATLEGALRAALNRS